MHSNAFGSYDDGILQPYFTVIAKGSNPDRKEEFVSVIRQVLGDIVKNGIDRKAVEAGINYFEFRYREADFSSYPKGLLYLCKGISFFIQPVSQNIQKHWSAFRC